MIFQKTFHCRCLVSSRVSSYCHKKSYRHWTPVLTYKSQCQNVQMPKCARMCWKVPMPISPLAKKNLCQNVHVSEHHQCRDIPVSKFSCAKKSMPKRPHVKMFQCWNVHLPECPQCRTVHLPKNSCDETPVPKWLLPKCPVPKWSTGCKAIRLSNPWALSELPAKWPGLISLSSWLG